MCNAPDCEHTPERLRHKGRNWNGPFRKTPGRLFGMGLIRLYQLTLSGFIGNSCRHLPTCSEYGYEAIARHGLWRGGFMTLFRVARCGPGGTHGFGQARDLVVDHPVRRLWGDVARRQAGPTGRDDQRMATGPCDKGRLDGLLVVGDHHALDVEAQAAKALLEVRSGFIGSRPERRAITRGQDQRAPGRRRHARRVPRRPR